MKTGITGLVLMAVIASVRFAQGADGAATDAQPAEPTKGAIAVSAAPKNATNEPPARVSKTVADIVKLNKAGVDAKVIQSYLDQNGGTAPPTADEIVYLKGQGVSDDVIAAMINRGGAARTQIIQMATQDDQTRDAMMDARQRAMFSQSYPPVRPALSWEAGVYYPSYYGGVYYGRGYRHRPLVKRP